MPTVQTFVVRETDVSRTANVGTVGKNWLRKRNGEQLITPSPSQLVGPQFLEAVQPSMGAHWNPAVEAAWHCLMEVIAFHMKRAMLAKKKKK